MDQGSSHIEKRQDKSALAVGIRPPWPEAPSRQPARAIGLHAQTPLCHRKDLVPSPWGTDIWVGLARCHMNHILKQNKGAHIKSETGEDIPTQGDKPAETERALYRLGGKCSSPKAYSSAAERRWKNCTLQTAFPITRQGRSSSEILRAI